MNRQLSLPEQYSIEQQIGSGPVSITYRATDLRNRRAVVIKALLPLGWLSPEEAVERAQRMLLALSPLTEMRHPALADVYEVGVHADTVYLVRERLSGPSYGSLSQGERVPPLPEARAIDIQLSAGLDALASIGLEHGALTANNLFLLASGKAKLTDAGFSALASHVTVAGIRCRLTEPAAASDAEAIASLLFEKRRSKIPSPKSAVSAVQAPSEHPSVLRRLCRPAMAAGLFGALATVGAAAYPEPKRTETPMLEQSQMSTTIDSHGLSLRDTRIVQRAVRRQGVAALADEHIADLFELTDEQRSQIAECLSEQRERVHQVVLQTAEGFPVDTGQAMREIRESAASRILSGLDEVQRARWATVAYIPEPLAISAPETGQNALRLTNTGEHNV